MKVLQVIPYFVPAYGYGGPLKACFDISKELTQKGHEITVATTDALDNKKRIAKLKEEINGIKIIRFRNISNWLAKNYNGYLPFGFYFWAKNNIRKFEAVHCHDFFTLQNIITSHFCKKYGIPFVVQPHGTLSPVRQEARFKFAKRTFIKLLGGVLKNSKSIIALTQKEKEEIIQINKGFKNKIEVIPNGLRPEEFENIEKIDLHKKYDIPKENKIIGFIGRIQYIKGIDISLNILASLKDKIKFAYLIIGPNEGEKERLEKMINKLNLKENIVFAGILTGKEKLETIKSCDLFLFTSRNEGLPFTVLEIAALGIPQIISKDCNVPEIEACGAGFEIDLADKDLFAAKIDKIISDSELSAKLSFNARMMVFKKFNIRYIVDQLEQTYSRPKY